jgi:hypothetical protein
LALTTKHKQHIFDLDFSAKQILRNGGEEALLMSLANKMNLIKDIMDSASEGELDRYCEQYSGFYQYMNLLERLAIGTSTGLFNDIIKR